MIAEDYAKALIALENPDMTRVREALSRRGHLKLMPRIFSEYKKLLLQKERARRYAQATPESERTRILLELYKKLIASR